ncbi:MAG: Uma2 family endonuclease [Cytophagales bacterium]|nr:Uma2 family endonuclease [Armatimonadota bacterium]
MSQLVIEPVSETAERFPNRKRWTRDDCAFLERVGLLPERYELIDGEIVSKMGQNRPHAITVTLLIKWLVALFGGDFVQCQLPIEVESADRQTYQPEPDAAVLVQPVTAYVSAAPGPDDLRLLVEVSDSTLRGDLQTKAALYARAGVPEYWVLDVISRQLFVHRIPRGGAYAHIERYGEEESVATEAAPGSVVRIADLLPPVAEAGR